MDIFLYGVLIFGMLIIIYFVRAIKKMKNMKFEEKSEKIINLTSNNFDEFANKGLVLIDFWAAWCMPCRALSPIISEIADEVDDSIRICKVNIDQERSLANRFSIRSIPTIVILKDSVEVERILGIRAKSDIIKKLNSFNK